MCYAYAIKAEGATMEIVTKKLKGLLLQSGGVLRVAPLAALCIIVFNTSSVSASSIFDDTYQTTEDTTLESYMNGCGPTDLSDWINLAADPDTYYIGPVDDLSQRELYAAQAQSIITETLANGAWAVSQYESYWGKGMKVYLAPAGGEIVFERLPSNPWNKLLWIKSEDIYILDFSMSLPSSYNVGCNQALNAYVSYTNNWADTSAGFSGTTVISTDPSGHYGGMPTRNVYVHNFDVIYPVGYEGSDLVDVSTLDLDGDGLNGAQENLQGTSHFSVDTDKDGLSDLVESIAHNPFYGQMYCKQTSPFTCADPNPLQKDLFIEIDWMEDSTRNFKPTYTQKAMITAGLDDRGYAVHIDTGEFGGGNPLPYVEDLPILPNSMQVDLFDLKSGNSTENVAHNFDPIRQDIWRYIVSGYNYQESPTSSGATLGGADLAFISYGWIDDNDDPETGFDYSDFDTAIAGTVVHELGHNLCLTDDQTYSHQSGACIFPAVDSYTLSAYDSVMNYNLQFLQTNYSEGSNGSGDHDDWTAIDNGGINDFTEWTYADAQLYFGSAPIFHGVTVEQVQAARKKGTYGKLKKGKKIYDLRHNKIFNTETGQTENWNRSGSKK